MVRTLITEGQPAKYAEKKANLQATSSLCCSLKFSRSPELNLPFTLFL